MDSSKHQSSVALFPLCDARSVLMDALHDTSDSPATRGDALVFAWRLELPDGMNVAHAANAVLLTALSVPRSSWSRRQLLILRELMVLAGRNEALPNVSTEKLTGPVLSKSTSSAGKPKAARKKAASEQPSVAKQDKDWFKLVGPEESN